MLSGDTLFRRSIGRTDLPGGDIEQETESIRKKLYTLDPETVVYPGHGPETRIDEVSVAGIEAKAVRGVGRKRQPERLAKAEQVLHLAHEAVGASDMDALRRLDDEAVILIRQREHAVAPK